MRTHDDVIRALDSFKPDTSAIRQFLHYLAFEFYSFARFKTRRVPWTDGTFMTATQSIDYQTLRLPDQPQFCMERRTRPAVTQDSVLFDRYRQPNGSVVSAAGSVAAAVQKPNNANAHKDNSYKSPTRAAVNSKDQFVSPPPLSELLPVVSRHSSKPVVLRKFLKLRQNPVMFFRDSKFGVFRSIGESISYDESVRTTTRGKQ